MSIDLDLDDLIMTTALADIRHAKILIVDDNPLDILQLKLILEDEGYGNIFSTTNPLQVIPLFKKNHFDLILLAIKMPKISGIEILTQLSRIVKDDFLPVIVLCEGTDRKSLQQALASGAKDYIPKPFDNWEVLLRIQNTLQTGQYYTRQVLRADLMENEIFKRTKEIRENQFEIVQCLGVAGELRDNETGAHVQRMSHVCALLAEKRGLGSQYAELLLNASVMHDIGKIGVPDSILLKAGKLSEAEWLVMQQHPKIGAQILGKHQTSLLVLARETALYHHEKWDGSGYPHGISGNNIPVAARIAAISDVFDALVSDRPYKKAWPIAKAIAILKEESGKHFEPIMVDLFIENISEIIAIRDRFCDHEEYLDICESYPE